MAEADSDDDFEPGSLKVRPSNLLEQAALSLPCSALWCKTTLAAPSHQPCAPTGQLVTQLPG